MWVSITYRTSSGAIPRSPSAANNLGTATLVFVSTNAASPAPGVLYMAAGQWPVSAARSSRSLSQRAQRRASGRAGRHSAATGNDDGYTAELWRSTDGGDSWKLLLNSTGSHYFTSVDCFDEQHCALAGEGFGKASTAPGAYLFTSSDGQTFDLAHHESVDGASLVTVQMLSPTEHWAGGNLGDPPSSPALALHSTDGGKSYTNAADGIDGEYLQSIEFVSASHGLAIAINSRNQCSLLEYS